jgi:MOSC domain-containing protein YiiM
MAKVIAVCRSENKGTRKESIGQGVFKENFGLLDDAHSESDTHRQVSLLALESIEKMRSTGLDLKPGDFAENLTTEGLDLPRLPVGSGLSVGQEVLLEVTQIGKECHTGCAIFKQVGKCIMPKEGIFAKVIQGGIIREGDAIQVVASADVN